MESLAPSRSVKLTTRADARVRTPGPHPLSSLIMGFAQVKGMVFFPDTETLLSSKYFRLRKYFWFA